VEAEANLRHALGVDPYQAAYWNELAICLQRLERPNEAGACAERAIQIDGKNAAYWVTMAQALHAQARWTEAAEAYRQSLSLNSQNAATWNNLAAVEQKIGRLDEAQAAYERSLALAPGHPAAIANYACLIAQRGERSRALGLLNATMTKSSGDINGLIVLGGAFQTIGEYASSESAYRQAIEFASGNGAARYGLALALLSQYSLQEAESLVRGLLAENPDFADGWSLLAAIRHAEVKPEEEILARRRSLSLQPDAKRHSKLLHALQYIDEASPSELLEEHRRWNTTYAQDLMPVARSTIREGDRPLRIGLVSSDFGQHPTGFLVLPVLEHLNKLQCSLNCYSDREGNDEYATRFHQPADLWRATAALTDEALADQIRRDEIDVLVDLMGHTGERMLVFARKPAPMQVTWFGYVGTTGLAAMDFLLADRFHVREREERYYVEQVLRMPNGYACYGPPDYAPEVVALPALGASSKFDVQSSKLGDNPSLARRVGVGTAQRSVPATFTFGSFNNPAKFSPTILSAWAEILRRVPGSRLFLKYGGLDEPRVHDWIRGQFGKRDMEPERIVFEGWSPHRELLEAYNRVDLALDTQPYSGGVTTCEALWMGVPVITYPGKTFAGRHSVSHLTNAGYEQFIAADLEGYIELAVEWTGRLEELAVIRAGMRERVRASPLCDAPRFARDFLALLEAAWKSKT
jgi:predicted O-linked N-acetylglucosamine transferase (SPINDLY family)